MKNEKTSLVFFGSGPVAAESLRLLAQDFAIEAVITKPSTAKDMALICPDSPLLEASSKSELDTIITEHKFYSKVGVLIDFGIIVSRFAIDSFELGIINSHFSLLPEMRGADPISFAILEGKEKTGVSLMLLVEAMDEGPVLAISELELSGDETAPSLTSDLIDLSHSMIKEIMTEYASGIIIAKPQQEHGSTYTRKLTKGDGIIDWTKSAIQIEREIRAYIEWPKSRATIGEVDCVITEGSILNEEVRGEPGSLFIHNKKLGVVCGENALIIDTIKPAGKNKMDIAGFLNGYRDKLGV